MNWYLSRLASMQPSEVLWRARNAARGPFDWLEFKTGAQAPPPEYRPFDPATYPVRLHNHGSRIERIPIFDMDFPVGTAFDWHRDYRHGKIVDRRFAGGLNIRDTAVVGDIKYIWEISRHQFLSALAFAANGSEQTDWIVATLDSWLEANPFRCGVNWTSSLELGLRLISWSLLYPRIACAADRDEHFHQRLLSSVYFHLKQIASHLSRYSSANNHLIGELAGLYAGASCFPFWKECAQWRASAKQELEREILLQFAPDGMNREQAMSYHLFSLELLMLCFLIGRNTGDPFSESFAHRLRAACAFLDSAASSGGDLPWYGDSDDARGTLFAEGETALQVTSQLGALLFEEPAWFRFSDKPTSAAQALLPDLLEKHWPPKRPAGSTRQEIFPEGGLVFVRNASDSVCMMMDFGPLGYTSIAAHGHADALSIGLAIDDAYFLVDSGTFAYHSHRDWRSYFRGTAAHNTARIDGEDQSLIAGPFLWSRKANTRLLQFENTAHGVVVEAEHDGYARLADPVIHRRRAVFNRDTGGLRLEDTFRCAAHHQIELFFHMHEDSQISRIEPGFAEVMWRRHRITFGSTASFLEWAVIRGSENPKLGWRSLAFNQKQPIPTLRLAGAIRDTTTITLDITVDA